MIYLFIGIIVLLFLAVWIPERLWEDDINERKRELEARGGYE